MPWIGEEVNRRRGASTDTAPFGASVVGVDGGCAVGRASAAAASPRCPAPADVAGRSERGGDEGRSGVTRVAHTVSEKTASEERRSRV